MKLNEALWQFPCDFPLKIMGPASAPLKQVVSEIVLKHVPDFDPQTIQTKQSRNGKYQSITVKLFINNKEQVLGLYQDFDNHQKNSNDIALVL